MKKHNNSAMKSEPTSKRTRSRGPVQRDPKEVLAELVETLRKKLDPKVEAGSTGEEDGRGKFRPNLDRLTVKQFKTLPNRIRSIANAVGRVEEFDSTGPFRGSLNSLRDLAYNQRPWPRRLLHKTGAVSLDHWERHNGWAPVVGTDAPRGVSCSQRKHHALGAPQIA